MSNAAKNFGFILTIGLNVLHNYLLHILIVQQNYFSDLYPAKILNLSAKPFFPCRFVNFASSEPVL